MSMDVVQWLRLVYGHGDESPRPSAAAEILEREPGIRHGVAEVGLATGDESAVRAIIAGGLQNTGTPLATVTLSSLMQLPRYRDRLVQCAKLLLEAGADPNQAWVIGDHPLSALYGAAGRNHDVELTRILLDAGANPNDNESLYHAVESRDLTCARLLLEAGAKVEGVNAIHHCLDSSNIEMLRLLLRYTTDLKAAAANLGNPLLWAIKRRRSAAHVQALLDAGADTTDAYRMAIRLGLNDVAALLPTEPLSIEEEFVNACAGGREGEARRILEARPDVIANLNEAQLQTLPLLAGQAASAPVRLMVTLGWPVAARGGDLHASALNYAVFNGDSSLARFLLENGASWTERHRYNDNVHGTLQWASRNRDPRHGDWVGCARALLDHGMPMPDKPGDYSTEVAAFMAAERARAAKGSERG